LTTTAEKLIEVDRTLRFMTPYNPGTDPIRGTIVVLVGQYFVHREQLSLIKAHEYSGFGVQPPRRENPVLVYVLETGRVNGTEVFTYHLLDWPHRWVKGLAARWSLIFPALRKIPWVPVKEIPPDRKVKPVKIGPKVDLNHRDVVEHLRRARASALRKLTPRRSVNLRFPRLPVRTRTNPETITWKLFQAVRDYWTPLYEVPTNPLRYYRSFSSTNTPGFRGMRKGSLPVNPYSLVLKLVDDPMGHDLRVCTDGGEYGLQNSADYYSPSSYIPGVNIPAGPVHDGLAHNKALASLIRRADGFVGLNGNLAQDLAQFGQLTRMVGDSVNRINRSIRLVKKGRLDAAWSALVTPTTSSRGLGYRVSGEFGKRPKKSKSALPIDLRLDPKGQVRKVDLDVGRDVSPLKSVAENWLALQYGWKPLLYDIHGALQAIADYMVRSPEVVRTARGKGNTILKTSLDNTISSHYTQKTGVMKVTTKTFCTIGIRFTVDSSLRVFAAQTGFTNPINLAWEVLPYSFVSDWFLPIGPYLETLSAFDGLKFLDGFESNKTVQYTSSVQNYNGKFPINGYPHVTIDLKGNYWRTWVIVNRTKLFSFPVANFPDFKNPLSVTHVLNGLALLRAAFK